MHEWIVDIPNSNAIDRPWIHVKSFETRSEAIEFLKEHFGADDDGKICLLSYVSGED